MRILSAVALLVIGTAAAGLAVGPSLPEIDPATGVSALAALAGGLVILRGRRRR